MSPKPLFVLILIVLGSCTLSEDVGSTLEPAPVRQAAPLVEEPKPVAARRLVDLEVKPIDTYARAGEVFSFSNRLTSRGSENTFQVLMRHEIRSLTDHSLLVSKDETIGLETISSKRTELIIPRAAKKGRYVLETKATYESGSADSSFEFDIEAPVVLPKPAENPATTSKTDAAGNVTVVSVTGLGFEPRELTISKGSIVVWINKDSTSHTATGAGFDLVLRAGEKGTHLFNESRTYSYSDTFSGIQPGLIVVKD